MMYTIEERHEIYKEMRSNILRATCDRSYSLCLTLMMIIEPTSFLSDFVIPKCFTELLSFKPKNCYNYYWFYGDDLESREKVLDACIKMTKPKNNEQN